MASVSTSKSSSGATRYTGGILRDRSRKKKDKSAEYLAMAKELGLEDEILQAKAPKENFLTKIGKIVDAPRQAINNAYSYATGSKRTRDDKSIFDAMGKGLTGQREINVADILEDSGMGDEKLFTMPLLNKDISLRDTVGLAGDLVLDPLNLVTFGTGGLAKNAVKLAGKAGDATVHLNKAGRAAQKSFIQDAMKAGGKAEDVARQEFADLVRQSPDMLKKFEDYGGIKVAGKSVIKGRDVAKGFEKTKQIPVAGKLVEGTANAASDAANLFHKGFKAKQAAPEGSDAVNVANRYKMAKNASFDDANVLQKSLEKQIKKLKPKGMDDAEADRLLGIAIEDPNKVPDWAGTFTDEVKALHDELYKVDDALAKAQDITEEWYRDNYLMRMFKEDKATVDRVLSKYLTHNGLKNKPGFLQKRGFQGTTEDLVKFAESQGVKLTPASTAERIATRARMSAIGHAKLEATEGFKGLGVFDEALAESKPDEYQDIVRRANEAQNAKPIPNVDAEIKKVQKQYTKKNQELMAAIGRGDQKAALKVNGEIDNLDRQYAILSQNKAIHGTTELKSDEIISKKLASMEPVADVELKLKAVGNEIGLKNDEIMQAQILDPKSVSKLEDELGELNRQYAILKQNQEFNKPGGMGEQLRATMQKSSDDLSESANNFNPKKINDSIMRLEEQKLVLSDPEAVRLIDDQIEAFANLSNKKYEKLDGFTDEVAETNKKILKETNPKLDGYVEVPDIPELKGYKFHPEVAKFIHEEMTKVGKPKHGFLEAVDIAMGAWKGAVTTLFPAFHGRNMMGNNFNMWLGGYYNNPLKAGKIQTTVAKEFIRHPTMKGMKFVDEMGTEWTEKEFRKLGIMGGQAEHEANVAQKTLNKAFWLGREAGKRVEDPARIAFFLQQRALGKSVDDAVAHVNKYLFNYGNQTDMVRNIGRVVPFFTWIANNIPLQVEQLLKQPHRFNKVMNIYQNAMPEEVLENLPEYVTEGLTLDGGVKTNEDGEEIRKIFRSLGMPVEDIKRLDVRDPGRWFEKEILGSLAPGVKQAAELGTGRDFFRGEDLEELSDNYAFTASNYPKELQALLGYKESEGGKTKDGKTWVNRSVDNENYKIMEALGLGRALSTLFPAGADSSNLIENRDAIKDKAVLPFANSEYNMTQEEAKREKEMLERIVQLLVKEGKLKEYTNYYEPGGKPGREKERKGGFVATGR